MSPKDSAKSHAHFLNDAPPGTEVAGNVRILDKEGRRVSQSGTVTSRQRCLVEAHAAIREALPDRMLFTHSIMCQVGLPRRRTTATTFERRNGDASILLEAGRLWNGLGWIDQPLPYGIIPRLVLTHVSSEAIRTRSRIVHMGSSMRQFLIAIGMPTSGGQRGAYDALKRQSQALAACRLTLGMYAHGRVITVDAKPIKRFEAWLQRDGAQHSIWPASIELSESFFHSLTEHAVPIDHRALAALKSSALNLDIYAWLTHRLCRVTKAHGVKLSWANLREQFGQEYADHRNFKREFRRSLKQVKAVYPDARIESTIGGLRLFPSRPPLPKMSVHVRLVR